MRRENGGNGGLVLRSTWGMEFDTMCMAMRSKFLLDGSYIDHSRLACARPISI